MSSSATKKGKTEPRIYTKPLRELTPETSWGFDLIWFAREIEGTPFTPWQEWLAIHSLELMPRERIVEMYPDMPELWDEEMPRFKTILVMVARQNGKTHFVKTLIKWALFRKRLRYILGAAQSKNDAYELWEQICLECEANTKIKPRIGQLVRAHGFEVLRAKPTLDPQTKRMAEGGEYRIAANERGSGRGKTVNFLYMDELREHVKWDSWNALTPTTKSPFIGFTLTTSNAGDVRSVVLRSVRNGAIRAIEMEDDKTTTAIFEWSADPDKPITDEDNWLQANPDVGHGRMTLLDIRASYESMELVAFKTEVLCQWVEALEVGKIPVNWWDECAQPDAVSDVDSPVKVGIDVASNGAYAHIAIAAKSGDKTLVEVIASRAGYLWVPDVLSQLGNWFDGTVGMQVKGSPSSHLAPILIERGFTIREWQGTEMSSSALGCYNALRDKTIVHRGQPVLDISALGIKDRKAGDVFIWDREKSNGDAAPFIACNIAWWQLTSPDTNVSAYSDEDYFFDGELSDDVQQLPMDDVDSDVFIM